MKLFIDSSQSRFIAALIENNKVIFASNIETKYKVEEIIKFFENVPNLHKIEDIYINLGPGSFTGARIALLYVRTLAQLNNKIKIYTTNTYSLLSSLNKKFFQRKFFIFATKNKSYLLTNKSVKIVNKHAKESEINYDLLLSNFDKFLNTFTLSSLENLQPTYASQPQIGEIKK